MIQLNKLFMRNFFVKNTFKYCFLIFLILPINVSLSQEKAIKKDKLSSVSKKLNVSVSNLDTPSIGSIGVRTRVNDVMQLDVWQDMSASEIIQQLNDIPDVVSSHNLQSLLIDLYLSTSNPPKGSTDEIIKFVETKLIKIRNSGQNDKLYQIIKQLPQGKRWEIWRRWLTEYEFLTHRDKETCERVKTELANKNDYFWQMSRIFCLSIENKLSQAQLTLDLIKSKGFSNSAFENLFKIINGEKINFVFDNNNNFKMEPIHIIMMDTLKIPIKVNFIADFGVEYTSALLDLIYLSPKARSFLLDKQINYQQVSSETIIENYKSVSSGSLDIQKNFSLFLESPTGYNRANVWLSVVALNDDIKKAEIILKIIKHEMTLGRLSYVINMYLPVLESMNSASLTKELNVSIQKIKIAANPSVFLNDNLANIIMLKKDTEWNWDILLKENAWQLIPVFENAGMLQPKSLNWLNVLNKNKQENVEEQKYNKWNINSSLETFLLTKAIEEASNNDNKTLALILLARLIGNNPFVDFDISQLLTIRKSLYKLGFVDLANNLTVEIMTAKLIKF
tara:strand:+ start:5915 stop:7606 length:1692 start_codon:yes stop_codon:yes gene_type:complete